MINQAGIFAISEGNQQLMTDGNSESKYWEKHD